MHQGQQDKTIIYIYIIENWDPKSNKLLNRTKSGESEDIFGLAAFIRMSLNQEIQEMLTSSIFAIWHAIIKL